MQRPAGLPGRRLPATGPTQGTKHILTRLQPRLGGLPGLRCTLPAAVSKIPLGTHTLGLLPVPAACRDPLYQRLMDEICMHSAATGQTIGFDGRVLQVGVPGWVGGKWLGQRPAGCRGLEQCVTYLSIDVTKTVCCSSAGAASQP
jgi:hypothetical protein